MSSPWLLAALALTTSLANIGCRQLLDIQGAELDLSLLADAGSIKPTASPVETDAGHLLGAHDAARSGQPDADAGEQDPAEPSKPSALPTSANDAGEADAEPPEQTPCEKYCSMVMDHCQGEYMQYQELDVCMDVCALFERNAGRDLHANTVECRLRQADLARLEPFTHCKFAGPIGHGECGGNCEAFCDIMMETCTPDTADEYYEDRDACIADCTALPDMRDFSTQAARQFYQGPHVQCRAFHAAAATQEADYHCAHALGDFPCRE